jgi:D-alanyl-D-alanine endopeptidase (penicillin-binding protein 7)
MNAKATLLDMTNTRFADPTGLSPENVSTANDLAKMVRAAAAYPLIREYSTTPSAVVEIDPTGRALGFNNSNGLVKSDAWNITLQKTGYIREAGRCLVMLATIASKPVVIVLLDSIGKYTRIGDAERVKRWIETGEGMMPEVVKRAVSRSRASASGKKRVRGSVKAVKTKR